jgi:hypothetical protein
MMPERELDWSDRMVNLCAAAVQVCTLLLILEHSGWQLSDKLAQLRQRYRRWVRQQEFELYYQYVWKSLRHATGDEGKDE